MGSLHTLTVILIVCATFECINMKDQDGILGWCDEMLFVRFIIEQRRQRVYVSG